MGRREQRKEDESRIKLIVEKKLSTINYLRQLPKTVATKHEREILLAHHRENKKEFKELIKNLKLRSLTSAHQLRHK